MEGWVLLEVRKVGEGVWTLTLEISEERRAAIEVETGEVHKSASCASRLSFHKDSPITGV